VAVVIRHGWILVSFGWLLLVLEVAAVLGALSAPRDGGRPGKLSPAAVAAGGAAMVAVWYLSLWRDLRLVRREIVALLTEGGG
jgi:hypothetical protein